MHLIVDVGDTCYRFECLLEQLFQIVGRQASRQNKRVSKHLNRDYRGPTSKMWMLPQSLTRLGHEPGAQ